MSSVREVMVHRTAGRGQQMSEGKGVLWFLLVRKTCVNNEIYIVRGFDFFSFFFREILNL